jgi:hypothetical protein
MRYADVIAMTTAGMKVALGLPEAA